jgi:hypothetical protein
MRKLTLCLVILSALALAGSAWAELYPAKPQPAQFAPAASKTSKVFVVDPAVGSDSNSCRTFESPCATLLAAFNKTTSGKNDTVLIVGSSTGNAVAAALTWDHDYTHLVGLSGDLSMGQRVRVTASSTVDALHVITVSGSGCIFKNLQFYNGADNAANNGAAVVSGSRNLFENVFFAGMGDATASGAQTRAGGFSLTVSGAENSFRNCTIGLDTIVRSGANAELIVSGQRNRFIGGDIRSNSVTAGKFLVTIDTTADLRDVLFEDVLFFNYTENWATGITDAIHITGAGNTHFVILKNCQLVGVGTGWGDTVTHIYTADPAPNAGAGVSTNPTT